MLMRQFLYCFNPINCLKIKRNETKNSMYNYKNILRIYKLWVNNNNFKNLFTLFPLQRFRFIPPLM